MKKGKKMEQSNYENKKEVAPLLPKEKVEVRNKARVIKAHDGLEEGKIVFRPSNMIDYMVKLGFWERLND